MNVTLRQGLLTWLWFFFSFSLTCVVPFRVAMTNCRASYSSLQFSKFSLPNTSAEWGILLPSENPLQVAILPCSCFSVFLFPEVGWKMGWRAAFLLQIPSLQPPSQGIYWQEPSLLMTGCGRMCGSPTCSATLLSPHGGLRSKLFIKQGLKISPCSLKCQARLWDPSDKHRESTSAFFWCRISYRRRFCC